MLAMLGCFTPHDGAVGGPLGLAPLLGQAVVGSWCAAALCWPLFFRLRCRCGDVGGSPLRSPFASWPCAVASSAEVLLSS